MTFFFFSPSGGLGVAFTFIILVHMCIVRHLWWLYIAPGLAAVAVMLAYFGASDDLLAVSAGIAGAVTACPFICFASEYSLHLHTCSYHPHWWHRVHQFPSLVLVQGESHARRKVQDASQIWSLQLGNFIQRAGLCDSPCTLDTETSKSYSYTFIQEIMTIIWLAAACYLALHSRPATAAAVISGALLIVLITKSISGAQRWRCFPAEIYWLLILAFALLTASGDKEGVVAIIVSLAFGLAILLQGYRWTAMIYPGIVLGCAAVAAGMAQYDRLFNCEFLTTWTNSQLWTSGAWRDWCWYRMCSRCPPYDVGSHHQLSSLPFQ